MRLPVSKIYRAFPELDRFSDAECDRFVQLAVKDRPFQTALVTIGILALLTIAMVGGLTFFLGLFSVLDTYAKPLRQLDMWPAAQILLIAVVLTALVYLAAFLPRDKWIRSVIANRLRSTRCLSCNYSLLGLDIRQGMVECPECGCRSSIADRGLTAEDLLATDQAPTAP